MEYKIKFNRQLQQYVGVESTTVALDKNQYEAEKHIKHMLQLEYNIPGDVVADGFQIYSICSICGDLFNQKHGNQKYCSDGCSEQANKIKNAERVKKYLSDADNHRKHLIRVKTNNLFKKLNTAKKCVVCGSDQNIELHHPIYDDKYVKMVVQLCKHCHQQLHKEMK